MTATVAQFKEALLQMGSLVTYHREDGGEECPCRTPEGFRDPAWHHVNDEEPLCNEQGFLADATEFDVRASIQPALTRYARMSQSANAFLGSVERDDKLGIFPVTWEDHTLNFDDWSDAGEDYILHDGERYVVVTADKLADIDGVPDHHWEVALRRVKSARPTD